MSQNNYKVIVANPSAIPVSLATAPTTAVTIAAAPKTVATNNVLNVSVATTIKSTPGTICTVCVTTAGAAGAIHDVAAHASAAAANQIAVIPATVGVYTFNFPCLAGIVYVPGSAQVVSISFA